MDLIPLTKEEEKFLFFDEIQPPDEMYYKIYHDGGHYVGTLCTVSQKKHQRTRKPNEAIDELFDSLYYNGLKSGLKRRYLTNFIREGILEMDPDYLEVEEFIKDKIKKKLHNIHVRKKRFKRKAYLNHWNYFVTFTYDDNKQSEESFRKKLRKCLSNLHTRHGWKYMGIFERAPESGRLHFHGLLYVPDGEMVGKICEKRDFSTAQHKMQVTHSNNFFEGTFGRNDFEYIDEILVRKTGNIDYILKYMSKTNEKVVYSRGLPAEVCKKVHKDNIAGEYFDFVTKYVFCDDVIEWETDVAHYVPKQMNIYDILCHQRAWV